MKRLALLPLILAVPIFAKIVLNDAMTSEEKEQTGVNDLNYSQRMALQEWINTNFELKEDHPQKRKEQLYLSLNIEDGAKLELSNGSTYEIAPEDHLYTAYWITPFPVMLGKSDNPDYPVLITNMNTGTSVSGKQISTRKMLEEAQKQKQVPQEQPYSPRSKTQQQKTPQQQKPSTPQQKTPQQQKPSKPQQKSSKPQQKTPQEQSTQQ